ncbi:transposase [Metarhizium guizhouense ARSEF 977]|uniref:Transposase n=1 Tax=Metarhizium guizhouense (strain ARSEF 977) TaxID=1276136 RepID=A0A0B4GPR9_METGA|nr:transposase [Metarhizium guizhouense ARSEF 977]
MERVEDSNHFPDDCLPPEDEYSSREALYAAINAWAAPRGYAFVTGRSRKTPNGRQQVVFNCDRGAGRTPDALTVRQRQTTTKRTGCQFSVLAKEGLDKVSWKLTHRPSSEYAIHNHEPSTQRSAHPVHRKLSHADMSTVHNLANAGVAPKEIRSYLRNHSETLATQQDIYNCIAQGKRDLAKGQSNIHALANELDREGFWNRMQLDEDGRVTAVLFAHPQSLAYLRCYPDLLILDCTYKTNKYKMPLLDIVGVDACQRSFCVAFAFLSGEDERDYIWALDRLRSMYELCGARLPSVILTDRCLACMNAVSRCFPTAASLLCLWHANKAVLRYCLSSFTRNTEDADKVQQWKEFYQSWHELVGSTDDKAFEERLQRLKDRYVPNHTREVGYIIETWLDLYKEKLVKVWVDRHLHFGNVVTSRGEGIHELIKIYLNTSQLDLFEAWRSIKLAVLNQLTELQANQAKQQIRTPIELSGTLYSNIRGWVSHEALRKVEEQRKRLLKNELPDCTGVFTATFGLPCAHVLEPLFHQDQPLQLQHFHTHWHLQRGGTPQLILEPRQQFDIVTRKSKLPMTSTQREASAFEAVEATLRTRALPTCSNCHERGHHMRSKACPLRYQNLLQPFAPAAVAPGSRTTASGALSLTEASPPPGALDRSVLPIAQEPSLPHVPRSEATAFQMPPSPETPLLLQESIMQVLTLPDAPATQSPSRESSPMAPTLSYQDPRAIYDKYVAAREDWYTAQPRGSVKTNQLYRKAMKLPQRYTKADYTWCCDYKQMGGRCKTSTGTRDWTKEEMMAYLDWSRAEDERVEALVAKEMGNNPLASRRRGMKHIWKSIEQDTKEQQALRSNKKLAEDCIIVSA